MEVLEITLTVPLTLVAEETEELLLERKFWDEQEIILLKEQQVLQVEQGELLEQQEVILQRNLLAVTKNQQLAHVATTSLLLQKEVAAQTVLQRLKGAAVQIAVTSQVLGQAAQTAATNQVEAQADLQEVLLQEAQVEALQDHRVLLHLLQEEDEVTNFNSV